MSFTKVYHQRLARTPSDMQLAAYDFEDNKVEKLHLATAGTSIMNTVFAAGSNNLEPKECNGNERQWMPLASVPLSV